MPCRSSFQPSAHSQRSITFKGSSEIDTPLGSHISSDGREWDNTSMHYNPSPRALFSLIPQTMSTEVMSVLAEWPFTGARSTGTNSQGLLWALLATSSIDEISNAEDFAAVRRYITSKGVVGATGRTTVGLVFWLYPTGLHGSSTACWSLWSLECLSERLFRKWGGLSEQMGLRINTLWLLDEVRWMCLLQGLALLRMGISPIWDITDTMVHELRYTLLLQDSQWECWNLKALIAVRFGSLNFDAVTAFKPSLHLSPTVSDPHSSYTYVSYRFSR